MSDTYNPITPEEIEAILGEDPTEQIASLIAKGIIVEHHDGGFSFDSAFIDELLAQETEEDVWLG